MNIIKKLMTPSPVAAVNEELDRIKAQMQALASEEADAQVGIDTLTEAMRLGLEAGNDTTEIEGRIVTARVGLERLGLRHSMLERVAREKNAALQEKRRRLRVEALELAEAAAIAVIATADERLVEIGLKFSEVLSTRAQAEHDVFAINARLQHLGGVPRGTGDIAFDETRLMAEFLRRHPEATRPLPFGEQPCGPFTLTMPVLTPDRTVAALAADDEANAK